jgi:uncharacterized protein (DUF924 family)
MQADDILEFWTAAGPDKWFRKDEAFDAAFRERFLPAHEDAAAGRLDAWRGTPDGALALLILLDQFPRNAFRGTARVYATDPQARVIARHAVRMGFPAQVDPHLAGFFYLPFMHSEDLADQDLCVALTAPQGGEQHRFAQHHRDIVARFGRFPHRNAVLGRSGTPAEEEFLAAGGFAG